jgi:hypothetical protein
MKILLLKSCFLLLFLSTLNCSIFKSTDNTVRKSPNSFTYNYRQEKVWDALLKALEESNYRIEWSDAFKGELRTQKTTYNRDEIENFQKLKEIANIPKSPFSEYFEANYCLTIKMNEEKTKTNVNIEIIIQAFERGKFNKWIDLKSNGQKEKEILALLMKKLKEF